MKLSFWLSVCFATAPSYVTTLAFAQPEATPPAGPESPESPTADAPAPEPSAESEGTAAPPVETAQVEEEVVEEEVIPAATAEGGSDEVSPPPEPVVAPPPPEPVEEVPNEQDSGPEVEFALYADTYVSYNSSETGSGVPYHRAYDNNTPYDPVTGFPVDDMGAPAPLASRNGFGLSFVGLDASFDTGVVGATAILRFGPSVPIYYGTNASDAGIDSFLAGYVTVTPSESFSLDAGYFGTIYGAEVAESWLNANYTRGGLYYAMQPFYHFGAKGNFTITDNVGLTAMVVNGANNIADENDAPALGLQLALSDIGDVFNLSVGGFYETGDDSAWGIETFVDVVASLTLGDLLILTNFDYNINRGEDGAEDTSYYGVMGTIAYAFTPAVGAAVRGEYLMDIDSDIWTSGIEDVSVTTMTGTLDLKLVDHLFVRPEFRFETSSEDVFTDTDGEATDKWFTGIIGLVATSAP